MQPFLFNAQQNNFNHVQLFRNGLRDHRTIPMQSKLVSAMVLLLLKNCGNHAEKIVLIDAQYSVNNSSCLMFTGIKLHEHGVSAPSSA